MKREIDFTQYTIDELVEIRDLANSHIAAYKDGYFYICNVRSYGRVWREDVNNEYELQELCNRYDGDVGIVDVYSNHPDLAHVYNYGSLCYVPSTEDYRQWKDYEYLKRIVPEIEEGLVEWETRDERPFNQRPYFKPIHTREDLAALKEELEKYDMSFTAPTSYRVNNSEEA